MLHDDHDTPEFGVVKLDPDRDKSQTINLPEPDGSRLGRGQFCPVRRVLHKACKLAPYEVTAQRLSGIGLILPLRMSAMVGPWTTISLSRIPSKRSAFRRISRSWQGHAADVPCRSGYRPYAAGSCRGLVRGRSPEAEDPLLSECRSRIPAGHGDVCRGNATTVKQNRLHVAIGCELSLNAGCHVHGQEPADQARGLDLCTAP